MDEQGAAKTVQRSSETWPKKRTLIINAQGIVDYIRAGQLVKRFEEDVRHLKQRSGRHHGIVYMTAGDYADPVYIWYTATQVTLHFNPPKETTRG